ncbi:hypothetical protein BGZ83_008615 [Gryganskiella cystojenkinii]|nr:hypothetical protein BGZ83_008615 [Gryganskiella cystojenkinii]
MTFSPGGDDLTSKGWTYLDYIHAVTISWPMTPAAIKNLKPVLLKAINLHNRFAPIFFLGAFTIYYLAIAQRALDHLAYKTFHDTMPGHIHSLGDFARVREAARARLCRDVNVW